MKLLKTNPHFFLCFVFVLLLACKYDETTNDKKIVVISSDTLSTQKSQKVVIKSIASDPKNLEYMNFINYSYFNGTNFEGMLKENNTDSVSFILEEINQPQIIEIFSFGGTLNYNTRIFTSPDDTILMTLGKEIDFKGKNAAHYNFFKKLDSTNDEWAKNKYNGNLTDYKKRCQIIYQRRKQFFDDYIANNHVSK
ncbi:MAG: hypothetical protein Q8J97_01555, partial [Flavobacteriaceae bacterium]|nr:hypothetical protein [Flavobacteriaceae bacterium]